ncbi:O-antigen ligase family protein [Thiococcus pfennigii]|uniref:O-antigen ligase family protein n=1 Tax=Thiococcus pfennigii TaxID=1057 RepID=UPI0019086C9A|nr:O-antigen ligase family protein [Thiococcus pfennigii]
MIFSISKLQFKILFLSLVLFITALNHAPVDLMSSHSGRVGLLPFQLVAVAQSSIPVLYLILCGIAAMGIFMRELHMPRLFVILASVYFFPALIAIITLEDTLRYVSLFVLALLLPCFVYWSLEKDCYEDIIRWFRPVIVLLLLYGLFVSVLNISMMPRIAGFVKNPNTYGLILFVMAVIYFSSKSFSVFRDSMVMSLICVQILLTGSRLGFACFIVFLFFFISSRNDKNSGAVFIAIAGILFAGWLILEGVINARSLDLISIFEFEGSGRTEIWTQAFADLERNWVFGLGLGGLDELYGRDNLHNSYLRLVLTLGVPLGGAVIVLFLYFTWTAFFTPASRPVLKSFFACLPILMVGEDYLVGVGSYFLFSLCLITGLLLLSREDYGQQKCGSGVNSQ